MDTTAAYRAVRERITEVATGADGSTVVPACPAWTVRDLLAHVTGVADDIVCGRLDGVGTDAWTAAQVRARSDRTVEEVLAEWRQVGPQMEEAVGAIGGAPAQLVFDTTTHEHDLRGAVGRPGARDDGAVAIALDWVAAAWAASAGGGPGGLRLRAGDLEVVAGQAAPAATVEMEPFEALRALTGRRSADELGDSTWDADPRPWLPLFTWGPFTMRGTPLGE